MTSISRSSRSRTALPYSVRLRRWTGLWPGFGRAAAPARSSARFERRRRTPSSVASSGRGMPCGGIMPPRSFATTFSQTSACAPASAGFKILAATSPPVFSALAVAGDAVLLDERASAAPAGDAFERTRTGCRRARPRGGGRRRLRTRRGLSADRPVTAPGRTDQAERGTAAQPERARRIQAGLPTRISLGCRTCLYNIANRRRRRRAKRTYYDAQVAVHARDTAR